MTTTLKEISRTTAHGVLFAGLAAVAGCGSAATTPGAGSSTGIQGSDGTGGAGDGATSGNGGTGQTASSGTITQTNLVSDQPGAAQTDPNLVNAWGLASGPATFFWAAAAGTGVSTLYDGAGNPQPAGDPLVVTIPAPASAAPGTASSPTGVAFNASPEFLIQASGAAAGPASATLQPARFIFVTEDGVIAAWSPAVSAASAITVVDNSAAGAVYKGVALASSAGRARLYAANFSAAKVEVYDGGFAPAALAAGAFVDPALPEGFAPFNIAAVGDTILVAYAKQSEDKTEDVAGPGNGFVDVFSPDGVFVRRAITQGALSSPWGMAVAPIGFGALAGALLVGNFGDGTINAYDATTFSHVAQLTGTDGQPLVIDGLWALLPGNGLQAGDAAKIYFTAGPDDEQHGLFGSLEATPGPATANGGAAPAGGY